MPDKSFGTYIHPFRQPLPFSDRLASTDARRVVAEYFFPAFCLFLQRYSYTNELLFGLRKDDSAASTLPVSIHVDPERRVEELMQASLDGLCKVLSASERDPSEVREWTIREDGIGPDLHIVFDLRCNRVPEASAFRRASEQLAFQMVFVSGEWELQIDYDTRSFDIPRIESMAHVFLHIAAQVMASPQAGLRDLSLMDAAWTDRVMAWSRGRRCPLPEELLIHRAFQRTAARFPEAIAIEHEGAAMTYRALDMHSDRLAHDLVVGHGIMTGERVAISLTPGISHVVSILAVLKAGAVFVPVDPSLPEARIRLMLRDVEAGYIISDEDPGVVGIHHILPASTEPHAEVVVPEVYIDSEAPAYCLFSSGSTGQPKAIAIPHRSFTCIFENHVRWLDMTPDDRVLQRSSLSFLMSLAEIFHALFSGATLVIAGEEGRQRIGPFIREHGITVAAMTPSLTSTIDTSDLASLRVLFQAGEAATASDAMRLAGTARLCYGYGSSEANTTAWMELMEMGDLTDPLPIGRPLDNVDNYILDPYGHPVPPYLPGDMHVGGVGVGLGYVNRSDLTAERFIPSPFDPSGSIFRSGDRVYRDDKGLAFFLGRSDDQVKVRGYRIEPAEIAHALEAHPDIEKAIVLPERESAGTWRIDAYLRFHADASAAYADMRRHLVALLPEYMIPSRFMAVGEIPLLASGKVDRQRLRDIGAPMTEDEAEGQRLTTPTEHRLAELWSELLGVEVRHRDADFFRLGGHSLIAMRLMSRVHSSFGVHIHLPDLFSDARLDRLAARIDEARGKLVAEAIALSHADPDASLTAKRAQPMRDGADIDYPASLIQVLFWRHVRWNPNAFRNPLGAMFWLQGRLDVEALRSAIALLSASQPALRTVFFERNGEVYQRVKPHQPIPLELFETTEPLSETSPDLHVFMTLPFDLEKGPLLRFRLVSHNVDSHILQVATPHIVFDAVSMSRMFEELSEYYNALIAGEQPKPKARRLSLGDLAMEERAWLKGKDAEACFDYWMQRFDLRGMEHGWPGEGPGKGVSGQGGSVHFEIELENALSGRIHAYTGRQGTTLFRFLLGTYFLTLQGLLPGRAVTVGVPMSLRRTDEEQEMIGCLISTLPLTLESIRFGTASDRLKLAEWRLDEAIRHGRIPWQHMVDRWKGLRGVAQKVTPKTILHFREQGSDKFDLHGLKAEHLQARRLHQPMDIHLTLDGNSDLGRRENIRISGSYEDARLTRAQVDILLDAWVSVMRHCTDGEAFNAVGHSNAMQKVYAFAGGAGGFDEHAKFHRMGECLGEGIRIQVLPDPEASFGLLPGIGVRELAEGYAKQILETSIQGKVWLLGEGLGAVDAFATACALQRMGVEDVGLILQDPEFPNPAKRVHTDRPTVVEAYGRMPEIGSPLQEWLFDFRLRMATRGPFRSRSHPVPKSRRQVFRAALAYGLFDPEYYRARYGKDGQAGTEESWFRYLSDGWRAGRHPSERFHAYRYEDLDAGFAVGTDEPVLHALLYGMRRAEARRRIAEGLDRPLHQQELLAARRHIRLEGYRPERFQGHVHLIMTDMERKTNALAQWQACVDGEVNIRIVDRAWEEAHEAFVDIFRYPLVG